MQKHLSYLINSLAALSLVFTFVAPVTSQAQTASSTTAPACYTFTRNLGVGSSGADVSALQNFLQQQDLLSTSGSDKGSYDETVASAVTGFQQKYASNILTPNGLTNGTGYVGASTRAKLNSLYGCTPVSNGGNDGSSFCYNFTKNLSIGSTGADVVALQNWLIANAYHIPAIESGAQPKGYYGNQTANALTDYQAAVGITESYGTTGYFGPQTRAKLNANCGSNPTPTPTPSPVNVCPAGFVCTPVNPTPTPAPTTNGNFTVSFQAVFNKSFGLTSVPSSATLSLAADNEFIAYVNGNYVGTGSGGTYGDDNFDHLTTFNVAKYLHTGTNTLSITGQNYYSSAPSWPDNAMGLLYKLTDQNGNVLAASDGTETIGSATIGDGSSVVLSQPHPWYVTTPGASWIWDSADPLYQTYLAYTGQGSNQNASITITNPTAGQSLTPGQTVSINWSAQGVSSNVPYIINIYNGPTASIMYPNTTLASGIYGTSYNWTVSTNNGWGIGMNPLSKAFAAILGIKNAEAASNQYTIQVCVQNSGAFNGNSICSTGTPITIGQSSTQPPVISGVTSPTRLAVNQTGTWSVNAYDPNNGSLSYSVNWGDSNCPTGPVCLAKINFDNVIAQQTSTFTHSFANPGTYTVYFTATNSRGLSTNSSATVNVISPVTSSPAPTASISATLDATSPLAGLVQISTAAQTHNVPLLAFDLKSSGQPATLSVINVNINASQSSLISQLKIRIGSVTLAAVSLSGTHATFSNFGTLTLPADTNVPVTILADIAPDTNGSLSGSTASVQVPTSGIIAMAGSPSPVPVSGGTISGSTISFSSSPVALSNASAGLGSAIVNNNTTAGYNATFGFTLTAGNSTLYVSSDPSVFVPSSVSGSGTGSLTNAGMTANPGQIAGDTNIGSTNGYYVIPAGASRQFTFRGAFMSASGPMNLASWTINKINYGTNTTNLQSGSITTGLQSLKVSATLGGSAVSASASNSNMTAAIYSAINDYFAH